MAPFAEGPVARLRVPGASTTVVSDSAAAGADAEAEAAESPETAVADAAAAESVADAAAAESVGAAAFAEDALAMIELASEGEMVVVETSVLLPFELLLLSLEPAARASCERSCFWVSMKAMAGPARTAWVARSRTLLFRGWLSEVMKRPTGPSTPWGTMHWSSGREMEVGMPPTSIWQNRVEVCVANVEPNGPSETEQTMTYVNGAVDSRRRERQERAGLYSTGVRDGERLVG